MRYSVEIKKFLYSQYFFGGLRIAVGVSLPAVLCLIVFKNQELGFTIATGALGACVVDMPGPLKYKHNEMLACSVIGFLSALATGLATFNVLALWAAVVPLTFVLSLIVVYGNRWPQISFATLFMMVVTLEDKFTPMQALVNAGWILAGGLWYTYWATLVSRWQAYRIEKQALAEGLFACANYLLARADFYDLESDLDECYRNLVAKQIAVVEMQDAARDIVLRNLPKLRSGKLDPRRTVLFNLFINSVDLHDLFVGAHPDYPLVRKTFGNSDLMIFYRDLIRKAARDLDEIGLAVLQNRPPHSHISMKAELRAIEYELDQMRKHDLPNKNPEAYAAVSATFRRIWSATRLIDKIKKSLTSEEPPTHTEMRIDQTLSRFISSRRVPFRQIFSNLTMASPSFRHALRVTIAVAVGFWLGRLLPLTNAYWIVMTSVIILKPGYSLTKQRNAQRIVGTAIGCAASIALMLLVKDPWILLVIMFGSMVMSYSLLLFNYAASVVFTSSYVLLLFHLLAPGSMRIIGERAIDTFVGCMIAIAASRLFPYWEYRLMGKLIKDMVSATRQYLEASWWMGGKPVAAAAPSEPVAAGAVATGPGAHAHSVEAAASTPAASKSTAANTAHDRDFRYRLARKHMHVAFANLGQAFARMMLEPKAHQYFVAEINNLLVQSHVLASQITAAAPLLRNTMQHEGGGFQALQRALSSVRENLSQALTGEPPADQTEITKQLTRELDLMAVEAEKSDAFSPELTQEVKLLAHQCKQMLAASFLIRKDAGVIRLPQE
ncbi:FUSC family membrane protein [Trinickia sp. YCB016]